MPDVGQLLWAMSYWLVSMALVILLLPLERRFPRILSGRPKVGHFRIVFMFSLATLLLSVLAHFLVQNSLILLFLELKVVSIAKLPLDATLIFVGSFLLLDLLNFLRHLAAHHLTVLWRLHAVHHSDEHLTSVSQVLHHPVETILAMVWLLFFSVVLGVPLLVYAVYGLVVAVQGVVTHADLAVPPWLDRALRWLLVTPDFHRTHHSIRVREGNSNFGQVFTFWDRLFGTHVARPSTGEAMLVMGLPDSDKPRDFTVKGLLLHPLVWRRQPRFNPPI